MLDNAIANAIFFCDRTFTKIIKTFFLFLYVRQWNTDLQACLLLLIVCCCILLSVLVVNLINFHPVFQFVESPILDANHIPLSSLLLFLFMLESADFLIVIHVGLLFHYLAMLWYYFTGFVGNLHVPTVSRHLVRMAHVLEGLQDVFHFLKPFLWIVMFRYDFVGFVVDLHVPAMSR